MALTIKKSMNVATFWESWELVQKLVADEYAAVKGIKGFYDLALDLIWDCEEPEPVIERLCPECGRHVPDDEHYWPDEMCDECMRRGYEKTQELKKKVSGDTQ